MTSMPPT
uniref:Uncharacterized protein n=1 Tax=Romanomermis culicivorax TaxID=13658 RepID=A0A915JFQ7_ROMCU